MYTADIQFLFWFTYNLNRGQNNGWSYLRRRVICQRTCNGSSNPLQDR